MKAIIETSDEYKSLWVEIATAIKAKITFDENEDGLCDTPNFETIKALSDAQSKIGLTKAKNSKGLCGKLEI